MPLTPFKKRRLAAIVLLVLVALIIFRLCLPSILKWYVNRTLAKIPGYHGHVEDIDVHLWRGAYEIQGLDLRKIEGKIPIPFFSVSSADLSIQWKELFHGALVGKVILTNPVLNFVDGETEEATQTSINSSWQDRVTELFPLNINYFGIRNGEIHFQNLAARPPIDVHMSALELAARNLTNSRDSYSKLLASVDAQAVVMKKGQFKFRMAFNPFESEPTFDVESTLSDLPLVTLADFAKFYGGVKPEQGIANIYLECAAQKGAFRGYLKPFVTELRFASFGDQGITFGEKLTGWAGNVLTWVFKNPKEESVATKVEFGGRFDQVGIKIWPAVLKAFRHAFIEALAEQLDHSILLKNVQPADSKKTPTKK
jgi:hypothetical protein